MLLAWYPCCVETMMRGSFDRHCTSADWNNRTAEQLSSTSAMSTSLLCVGAIPLSFEQRGAVSVSKLLEADPSTMGATFNVRARWILADAGTAMQDRKLPYNKLLESLSARRMY